MATATARRSRSADAVIPGPAAPRGTDQQPLSAITWTPRDALHANLYNPNRVAPPELLLLRRSLLENGWTQPLVARHSGEIVDGFHRWTVAAEPPIAALTDGLVPVVYLPDALDGATQIMATVRHNRARGQHHVLKMSTIVRRLRDEFDLSADEIGVRLGMEPEEVSRLYDAGDVVQHLGRADGSFNKGWVPG